MSREHTLRLVVETRNKRKRRQALLPRPALDRRDRQIQCRRDPENPPAEAGGKTLGVLLQLEFYVESEAARAARLAKRIRHDFLMVEPHPHLAHDIAQIAADETNLDRRRHR